MVGTIVHLTDDVTWISELNEDPPRGTVRLAGADPIGVVAVIGAICSDAYPDGFTDISTGELVARTGVRAELADQVTEFRRKIVDLARSGRNLGQISNELGVARQSIKNWLKQEDLDAGKRDDGLTTAERQELTKLRRENKRLKLESEILSKAAAWFARETNAIPEKSSDS